MEKERDNDWNNEETSEGKDLRVNEDENCFDKPIFGLYIIAKIQF